MKIISGHDQKSASHFYLSNCTFKLLSTRGYSCTTYLCTFLPPAELSPYRGFTVGSTLFQPITEILLKLSYSEREDAPEPEDATERPKVLHAGKYFKQIKPSEMREEAFAQQTLYSKSLLDAKAFKPICPAVLFCQANPIPIADADIFIAMMEARLVTTSETHHRDHYTTAGYHGCEITFTLMECLTNAKTVGDVLNEKGVPHMGVVALEAGLDKDGAKGVSLKKKNPKIAVALEQTKDFLYGLARIHKMGFVHGDAHGENALVLPSFDTHTTLGTVYLIDFGFTRKMKDKESQLYATDRVKCLQVESIPQHGANPRGFFNKSSDEEIEALFTQKDRDLLMCAELTKRTLRLTPDETNAFFNFDICGAFDADQETFETLFFNHVPGRIRASELVKSDFKPGEFKF